MKRLALLALSTLMIVGLPVLASGLPSPSSASLLPGEISLTNTWTQSNGPWGHRVAALALSPSFIADHTLLVTTDRTYRSTTGGDTWTALGAPLPAAGLQSIYFSPAFSTDRVIFGAAGSDIWRSGDSGQTWMSRTVGLAGSIALSPGFGADHLAFAGTSAGLRKSVDGGLSWAATSVSAAINIVLFSPDYTHDATILAAGWNAMVRSRDRGATWEPVPSNGRPAGGVLSMAFSPAYATDHAVYILTQRTLYESSDAGTTWSAVGAVPIPAGGYTAISFPTASDGWIRGNNLASPASVVVAHTTDNGQTWHEQSFVANSAATGPHGMAFPGTAAGWLVTGLNLFHTTDGGSTWVTQTVAGETQIDARFVSFADAGNGWLLGSTLYHTTNAGATWTAQSLPAATGDAVALQAQSASLVRILTHNYDLGQALLLTSSDGGSSWITRTLPVIAPDIAWADVSFVDQNRGWVVGPSDWSMGPGSIAATVDGGQTWTMQSSGVEKSLRSLWFADASHGWVVGDGGVILYTANGGLSWLQQQSGVSANLSAIDGSDALHAWIVGDRSTFLRTSNGGAAWSGSSEVGAQGHTRSFAVSPDGNRILMNFEDITQGPAPESIAIWDRQSGSWFAVAGAGCPNRGFVFSPNFSGDHTVFLPCTDGSGLKVSTDGGHSWRITGLDGQQLSTLRLSPGFAGDRTVFAGAFGGMYRSRNGGLDWENPPSSLGAAGTMALAAAPRVDGTQNVLAGTAYHGVMQSADGGASWQETSSPGLGATMITASPSIAQDRTLLAWIGGGENLDDSQVYASWDNGMTWEPSSAWGPFTTSQTPAAILISPNVAGDATVFAADSDGVWRTSNFGRSAVVWDNVSSGIPTTSPDGSERAIVDVTISPLFAQDHTLLLITRDGTVYRTTNSGDSWITYTMDLGQAAPRLIRYSPAHAIDHKVYACGKSIYASGNAGANWASANSGLGSAACGALSFAPDFGSSRRMAALTSQGVYLSTDAGAHWTVLGTNSPALPGAVSNTQHPGLLWAHTAASDVLYATTGLDSSVVWTYDLRGNPLTPSPTPTRTVTPTVVETAGRTATSTHTPVRSMTPTASPTATTTAPPVQYAVRLWLPVIIESWTNMPVN